MKALGVQWNVEVDVFTFLLKLPQGIAYIKRGFLKKLATLFDPWQMLAPFTVTAWMAMQETWLLGLGWDDEFPDELRKKCEEWFHELPELSDSMPKLRTQLTAGKISCYLLTQVGPYWVKLCLRT